MVIGEGVSTAVMGGGRIIGHAPFIAASSAILPVVAPVMLFMTVSSLITGARLDQMQRALGTLSEVLARVRQDSAQREKKGSSLDTVTDVIRYPRRERSEAGFRAPRGPMR